MKVEHIYIKNFKGIDEKQVNPRGANVYVLGKNGKGKTSFLDAVWTTVTGNGIPAEPVKNGARNAEVEVNLGSHTVTAYYNTKKKNPQIKLVANNGNGIMSTPRALLNEWVGIIDFNPGDFFRMQPKKQLEFISKITGLDFSEWDNEYQELYEQRSYLNKTIKNLSSRSEPYDKKLAAAKEESIKDLNEEMIKAHNHNHAIDDKRRTLKQMEVRQSEMEEEIKDLEAKIFQMKMEVAGLSDDINDLEHELITSDKIDYQDIAERIENAERKNTEIRKAKEIAFVHEELARAEDELRQIQKAITDNIDAKRTAIADHLQIEGLEYDGERLLLDGLPFEETQINTAAQIVAGLNIGLKLMKDVRIMRFDGSLIDDDNMGAIKQWAKDNDVQLFVEIMDRNTEGLEIQIEQEVCDAE